MLFLMVMFRFFFSFLLVMPVLSSREDLWIKVHKAIGKCDIKNKLLSLRESNPESRCWVDIAEYISNIGKSGWANQMFDSIEKLPNGFLYGRVEYMGNFDECISARTTLFKGQHCMVNIYIQGNLKSIPQGLERVRLSYGLCLPSSCTAIEIQNAIDQIDLPEGISVTVVEKSCWTDDPVVLSNIDWIVISFLGVVITIAISSTILDLLYRRNAIKPKRIELYTSFSLYKNYEQLIKIHSGPDNVGCLHGFRTLSMCWVVLGHQYITGLFSPAINTAMFPSYMQSKQKIFVTNAFVSVDSFFFLSGFLATLVFFREISKKKSYDVPISIIHRYIRITPAYAVMILIQSTILLKMGRGPVWNSRIGESVKICRENWWPGLIYLQNFIAPESTCLGQSWYLSSDMQMFWLAPILLYPMLLWPKIGIIIYFLSLAVALITNFVVSFEYGLGPQLFFSPSDDQFTVDYVQTYMRLSPYVVGMGLGYIICGIKAKKIRVNLSKKWIILGWLISTGLCLGSIYGLVYFIDNDRYLDTTWESSSYLTFHRLGWSLGIGWVVFACIVGYGGPVNTILAWDKFQIFGKLSYCVFLVHFTVQTYTIGVTRTNTYVSDFSTITSYFSTLVYSVFFSVPMYLLFEIPFTNIDRYLLREVKIFPYPKPKLKTPDAEKGAVELGVNNKAFVE